MPKKTVWEMSELERRHFSLGGRTFRALLLICIVMSVAAGGFGLYLYGATVNREYRIKTWQDAKVAAQDLDINEVRREADIAVSVYDSLSEEERKSDPEEWLDKYEDVRGPLFERQRLKLYQIMDASDDVASYIAFLDLEHNRMVYILDCDPTDHFCPPGTWDEMKPEWMDGYVNGAKPHLLDGLYGTGVMPSIIYRMDKYGYRSSASVKLFNEDKYPVMVFCESDMTQVTKTTMNFMIQYAILLIVITLIVLVISLKHIRKVVVDPINSLSKAASDYSKDRNDEQRDGQHFASLDIRTGDEIENLSLTMKAMEQDIASYVENLTKVTAEKERVNTELKLATRIQNEMLPNIFPAFPDREEFNIYASMTPAKEVGGDFYDFFFVDQSHLALVIADVSGKGIPAAMFMMMAKTMIQARAMANGSPASVLEDVNNIICENNREQMFVTVWLGILDIETGILTAANAGHEYPVIKPPDGTFDIVKDKHGFVIGGMKGVKYKDYDLKMLPGSKIFVYTDGIPEAKNASDEMFGINRTVLALNRVADKDPEQILPAVEDSVWKFVGDAEQFDDMTMLCIEYRGVK
ncbi:MAG: PP2C family protein-serine/threonine phosphatase [Eubacterium sp.]|nr:PP2C family protein-serine/threonine phosphatase [Eubacterium sp.]